MLIIRISYLIIISIRIIIILALNNIIIILSIISTKNRITIIISKITYY